MHREALLKRPNWFCILELRQVDMYVAQSQVGEDMALFDLLWSNLIGEDIHTAWFANKLNELEEIGAGE